MILLAASVVTHICKLKEHQSYQKIKKGYPGLLQSNQVSVIFLYLILYENTFYLFFDRMFFVLIRNNIGYLKYSLKLDF